MAENNKWDASALLQITIQDPDDFLLIKESLTRIGVVSKRDNALYQSCHILHKRGSYYIVHFKELFKIDGRDADLTEEDIGRRNSIAALLENWGLCKVVPSTNYTSRAIPGSIKVLSHKEKHNWNLVAKYKMRTDRYKR